MGRKTNKQKIQDQLDQALKVGDLKKILDKLPDDMPIGRMGHFGEAWLISSGSMRTTKAYLTPDWNRRNDCRVDIEFLEFEVPDIGPDPD